VVHGGSRRAAVTDALRLAVGTLTVIPVRPPARVDRRTAGAAMAAAPATGGVLGGLAALAYSASSLVFGAWLSAALTVALLALLTRLIHWDGLADLADGLGSGRPADGALEVMRRSDIGPFGVTAIVLVLALQVGALAEVGPAHLVAAVVLGRWGLALACRVGVPAARPDGLGAVVAGSLSWPLLFATAASTAVLLAAVVVAGGASAAAVALAWVASTVWSVALSAVAVRRLGGVTGDVLGALAETSTAVALLVLAAW
jgi:adenosylcobinamide-GDP ribazoletransferase